MAVKSGYTVGRPIQEVRLRNWPAGKTAQLKRAVELLENQLNTTMAAQVDQGSKAVVSSRVPKVVNLQIHAGFKNFQVTFDDAKGIDDLLFYEIQQDTTGNFSNPTVYRIPQTTLTLPTTVEHQQIFIRVRAQNSRFEVGPWSASVHATGSSNFRITVNRSARTTVEVALSDLDNWVDITGVTYTPTAAAMCIHIHAGMFTHDTDPKNNITAVTYTSSISNQMRFRVLRDGVELTNAGQQRIEGFATYTIESNTADTGWIGRRKEMVDIGTMVTPFETFLGNEDSVTFILQAKLTSEQGLTARASSTGHNVDNESVTVIVDAFDVMEIIQSL